MINVQLHPIFAGRAATVAAAEAIPLKNGEAVSSSLLRFRADATSPCSYFTVSRAIDTAIWSHEWLIAPVAKLFVAGSLLGERGSRLFLWSVVMSPSHRCIGLRSVLRFGSALKAAIIAACAQIFIDFIPTGFICALSRYHHSYMVTRRYHARQRAYRQRKR